MTLPRPVAALAARRARALADATRRSLLGHLRTSAMDVRDLAAGAGLHPNAVRQHLSVLLDAGLVVEEAERAGRIGRPRTLYRSAYDDAVDSGPFERLAAMLASVAGGSDVDLVGTAEGVRLARAHPGGDPGDVIADIAAMHGFAVRIERAGGETRVALGHCPFVAIAGPVVCGLHRAVLEGVASVTGSVVTAFDVADPSRRPCELALASSNEGAP